MGPLQPGRFDLRAQAPDLVLGFARDVPVVSGEVTSGIVIALSAAAVVRGRVTAASDGLPIERARVTLLDPTAVRPPQTAVTDAAGEFRMPGVAAGRRSLRVQIEGYLTELAGGIDVPSAGEVVRDVQLRQGEPDERYGFQGIGATLGKNDRGVFIAQLLDDAPAARAGLQAGDVILTVDGVAAAGIQVGQVVEMILGEARRAGVAGDRAQRGAVDGQGRARSGGHQVSALISLLKASLEAVPEQNGGGSLMAKRDILLLLVSLVILSCSSGDNQGTQYSLRSSDCKGLPGTAGQSCYMLSVKENRNDANSRFIDVFVVVLKALDENPTGKPTIFLHGGPGNRGTQLIDKFNTEEFRRNHDLVFFDQRGIGR